MVLSLSKVPIAMAYWVYILRLLTGQPEPVSFGTAFVSSLKTLEPALEPPGPAGSEIWLVQPAF